jgi:hypothetical protein
MIGFNIVSAFFLRNTIPTVKITIVTKVTNHDIITPASAVHLFCFFTNAIIPNIKATIDAGIHNIAPTIVKDNTAQTILRTKLVVESHDF